MAPHSKKNLPELVEGANLFKATIYQSFKSTSYTSPPVPAGPKNFKI